MCPRRRCGAAQGRQNGREPGNWGGRAVHTSHPRARGILDTARRGRKHGARQTDVVDALRQRRPHLKARWYGWQWERESVISQTAKATAGQPLSG